jgi:hypothetical protein
VVGVIDHGEPEIYAFGNDGHDGDTVFEVGSVSKVFTAVLLADAVRRGDVKLDDAIDGYVPEGTVVPSLGDCRRASRSAISIRTRATMRSCCLPISRPRRSRRSRAPRTCTATSARGSSVSSSRRRRSKATTRSFRIALRSRSG